MAELRFGIFDWIDKNESLSVAETYEQRLKMLELADEAGGQKSAHTQQDDHQYDQYVAGLGFRQRCAHDYLASVR